ncbi:MAG TPA: ABC transporter permease subunit [archaeon]|nr:ABC transporter permease subunit [archaeon]
MKTIITRELLDYLKSIQFLGLICLTVLLFTANGLSFRDKYSQELDLYSKRMAEAYKNPSTVKAMLYRQPALLSFISEGGDEESPPGYVLSPKGTIGPLPAGPRNFKLPDLPEPDWAFIIKIVFSLYAVLLGYGAVSGEKEQGTLRQTLANPVSRSRLLAAKYTAIVLTLIIPLLTGMLISLIIVSFYMPQVFAAGILHKVLLIFLLSFLYLSIFALFSLLLSSVIHQSSLVLLTLLTVWILFAVMIPNASGILAERFSRVPGEFQMAKQVGPMIKQTVWNRIKSLVDKFSEGEIKTEEELHLQADRVFEEGREELSRHIKLYENAMKQRQRTGRNISRISPSALFQYAAEDISGTGPDREEDFLQDTRTYSAVYDEYILKKVGKLVAGGYFSFAYGGDLRNGKYIIVTTPSPEEYQGDKSDFPRFSESSLSISRSLQHALLDISGLVLWNLALSILAFAAFSRSDVR